ncbi:hypothetical protein R1sor_009761 [Riccia sorocarpa]|uniref:Protein kinase domain-containing protein n=1 Tax=Riccia sorocarpa TaxID=122646 RepID=A0ABD3HW13_9MARC
MAFGSRQDKGKAPMIPEEDIGTKEGELVDQDPPRPKAVVRSDRDRKRKQIAVEEDPLAIAHHWFQWFTQETVNRTPIEQKLFTPRSQKGVGNFRSHLMELAVEAFLKEKENPDSRPWETGVSEMSQRLARFLEEVPLKWGQMYEDWLKSREFEAWTDEAVRLEAEKKFVRVPRAAMKNEEEQDKWRTIAKKWMRWFAAKKTITDFGSTSGKYKLCESVSDNTIRFISPKDSLTRTDKTTRLGDGRMGTTHRVGIIDEELAEVLGHHEVVHYALKVMHLRVGDKKVHEKCIREMMAFPESHSAIIRPIGLSKDKKKPMLLFSLWNGGTIEKWMNLEKRTRGRISPEGIREIDQKHRDSMTADEWLNIQLFRKHRLQIAGTMVAGLQFMHLHKWLHADIHKQNVLIHFPAWDWNQTKNRDDSGKDKDNKPLKHVIIRSLVFVGIGDLGKAQTLKEVAKDFDPYPVADTTFRPWIALELNIHKAKKIDAENPFITKLSPESDIFALGWLINELCGDYFTDMTDEERREYNRDARDKGLPYSDAADVHAQRLKEALDLMTWEKIRSPYGNQRRTMDFWAHYFSEQLFIDPDTCARPIERGPRAKAHPDGPQKVSKGNA